MKFSISFLLPFIFSIQLFGQVSDFKGIDFKKSDSVAALYSDHSLTDLQSLSKKLTSPFSQDIEKFRTIYMWVVLNIENDYGLYMETRRMREKLQNNPAALQEWNKKFNVRMFKKLMTEKKTVCSGYAYLIKELSSYAGLSSVVIGGYGRTAQANVGGQGIPNHSWNAVQLNKRWYLCDATWSSGAINTDKGEFVKKFDEAYFLAEPILFIRNHYPLDSTWMLLPDSKPTIQEFLNRPLVYSNIYKYQIEEFFPETFNISTMKGGSVSFCFKKQDDHEINKVQLAINTLKPILVPIHQNADGFACVDHTFANKGTYVVHLLIGSDYISSYTVVVK